MRTFLVTLARGTLKEESEQNFVTLHSVSPIPSEQKSTLAALKHFTW